MAKELSELTDEELDKLVEGEETEIPEADVVDETTEEAEPEPQKDSVPSSQEQTEVEPVEETEPPKEEKEQGDKAFNGIRKELTHERDRRRQAEQELQDMQDRLAKLEEKKEEPPAPLANYEDDDVAPISELRSTLTKITALEQKIQQQENYIKEKEHRDRVAFIDARENEARKKYNKESVGEYDYDSVRINGFMPLAQKNPDLFRAVMNSDNPAEEAYKVGLSQIADPYTLLTKKANVPAKQVKQMAKTIGSVPASGGALAETDIDSLSDADIAKLSDKELERLTRSLK